jgi:hypothetical protein
MRSNCLLGCYNIANAFANGHTSFDLGRRFASIRGAALDGLLSNLKIYNALIACSVCCDENKHPEKYSKKCWVDAANALGVELRGEFPTGRRSPKPASLKVPEGLNLPPFDPGEGYPVGPLTGSKPLRPYVPGPNGMTPIPEGVVGGYPTQAITPEGTLLEGGNKGPWPFGEWCPAPMEVIAVKSRYTKKTGKVVWVVYLCNGVPMYLDKVVFKSIGPSTSSVPLNSALLGRSKKGAKP